MPVSDKPDAEARSLDSRIAAAEAAQARKVSGDDHLAMAAGYRFLGEVVGGVFMGAAAGWAVGHFTRVPMGLALTVGLMLGAGLSIFVAVRSAARLQKEASAKAGPLPSVPDDEDED